VRRYLALILAVAVALSACTASAELTGPAIGAEASETTEGEQSDDGADLTSAEVYQVIADSVVYIEAPDGESSGSGIVIEDGWILTNAHVVDRNVSVRVGRSDGVDLGLHEVHAVDWIFDLALVGPVPDDSLVPMTRGVSADLVLGSKILLVGFPDEDDLAPTPTLTEGIVSRRRSMELGEFPFLQVDATIAPGQSGGALVNGRGELVGISGIEFGEGEFGLAFASDPMWPRVDALLAAGPEPVSETTEFTLVDQVGPLRNFGFLLEVDDSGMVDFVAEGNADMWIDVQTLSGITVSQLVESDDPFRLTGTDRRLYFDELAAGREDVIATVDPGLYQVVVGSFNPELTDVEIQSANPLGRFADIEEGRALPVGELVEGNFDWERDSDKWILDLEDGQTVSITADGIADTVLVVRLGDDVIASSDDERLGVFGTGSRVEFVADETGAYTVEVGTFDRVRWGYLVEVTVS